jgi:OMF family outer membrane factor
MKTKIQSNGRNAQAHIPKVMLTLFILINTSFTGFAQIWTLQQCIDTAQVHNKNLRINRNNIALGTEKEQEAKANLIPRVSIGVDYKYYFDLPYQLMPMTTFNPTAPEGEFKEIQFGVPHNINANIQLVMPLYNPQVYGAIHTTKIAAELNELQYKKAEEQVYFEISNLYYNASILMHQQAFIDSNLVNTARLLENLQLLYNQQMIKKTDVTKVELQKEQLLTQQKIVTNSFEQVINALKFSMGIPFTQNIQINLKIENQNMQNYSPSETVDLQLANAQKRLISSELKTLQNSRLPSVSLLGNYSQVGFGYDQKPNEFLKFFPVSFAGIQISYPLFNGAVTNRKINQKKLEIQNSKLQAALVNDQNNMLIDNSVKRRFIARQTMENTSLQINLATTIYEQMLLQQKEGTANMTEVLIADNALREAQQAYLSAIIDYLKADLELKKLTGNISIKN